MLKPNLEGSKNWFAKFCFEKNMLGGAGRSTFAGIFLASVYPKDNKNAYLRVLIYKQPDIETQIFWAHFRFCCPIPTTPHGGQS